MIYLDKEEYVELTTDLKKMLIRFKVEMEELVFKELKGRSNIVLHKYFYELDEILHKNGVFTEC